MAAPALSYAGASGSARSPSVHTPPVRSLGYIEGVPAHHGLFVGSLLRNAYAVEGNMVYVSTIIPGRLSCFDRELKDLSQRISPPTICQFTGEHRTPAITAVLTYAHRRLVSVDLGRSDVVLVDHRKHPWEQGSPRYHPRAAERQQLAGLGGLNRLIDVARQAGKHLLLENGVAAAYRHLEEEENGRVKPLYSIEPADLRWISDDLKEPLQRLNVHQLLSIIDEGVPMSPSVVTEFCEVQNDPQSFRRRRRHN